MKTVKGIYAEAKIFTDDVEDNALAQIKMICDNEIADGSTIRMMPDIHPGITRLPIWRMYRSSSAMPNGTERSLSGRY